MKGGDASVIRSKSKRLIGMSLVLLTVLVGFSGVGRAGITLTDATVETSTITADVTTAGTVSLIHVSHLGDLTTTAADVVTLTNYVLVGTPTLDETATCDQVAVFGTPAGDSACSEAWISLTASPFRSATDFHLLGGTPLINAGVTVEGHTADILGVVMQGSAWDIGAYEFIFGGGGSQHQHGFEMY